MKKLIFLLLMVVAFVGFISAGAAHPPGVLTLEVNHIEAALSEYCIDGYAVTSDTVLVFVLPEAVELSSLQAVMVHDSFIAIKPGGTTNISDMPTEKRQACTGCAPPDHYLRC